MSSTVQAAVPVQVHRTRLVSGVIRSDLNYSTILPRDYYVDEKIFEKEFEKVFSTQWTYVGHVSQVARVGDYFLDNIAGESIVVVRESADRISAFHNVCRHRGHHLCSSESGNVRRLTCPYHFWSYGLDGNLLNVPGSKDGANFDYNDWPLKRVNLEVFHGFIFACLSEQPPASLVEKFSAVSADLETVKTESLKEVGRESYEIHANWKTLLENYLECYHCQGSHPTLCQSMDLQAMFRGTDEWQEPYFTGKVPLRPGVKTVSMDGQLVSKPLGDLQKLDEVPEGFGTGFGIVPLLSRVLIHADHVVVHAMRPLDVGRVKWETRWYVGSDAVEGTDYRAANVAAVWSATNKEDAALCQGAYNGVRSRSFTPGPVDDSRESAIPAALRAYLELMQAD
ncbi:aromatic ring-hydroxylating oxygenase subunit alpha [Paraburkholderia oxyphila]|uniref:aromatic ring-hydroxylating oxygenase subunit alpha n=1 Tax=Paraburkholderia oxyphila TaxID=614212 RepID=UPI001428C17B|nr:aromatic ring-hydroxylating dioxygenase subunit alpha [Paraburkholderia oxyphila]